MLRREITKEELRTPLTPYSVALGAVVDSTRSIKPKRLRIDEVAGCVAAEEVRASRDLPGFSNSAMDGFALRSRDLKDATPEQPVTLPISGSILAGDLRPPRLEPKTCVEIGTGAPLPAGADSVVPFEEAERATDRVSFVSQPKPKAHVRPPDDVVRRGTVLVEKGEVLTPTRIGLLAQCGVSHVSVVPRPKVAIISTGDEIVSPGERFVPGLVYDANSYLLSTACQAAGCELLFRRVLADRKDVLRSEIRSAVGSADLVIVSGGASVGPHDWAKEVAGRLIVWRVALKPGKPFGFAMGPASTPVMLLPGNPGSAFVAFAAFGLDVIAKLAGRKSPLRVRATLTTPIRPDAKRILLRGVRMPGKPLDGLLANRLHVEPVESMSSASLLQFKDVDGLAFIEPGRRPRRLVEVLIFPWSIC